MGQKFKSYIKRSAYLNKIEPYLVKDVIKVFTGQRRVGKSYMVFQVIDRVKDRDPSANIVYINKELHAFQHIRTFEDLLSYVNESTVPGKRTYLFIDEVQEIAEFEKALRSLHAEGKCDIYCTGSNANLLSGELATLLSGRGIEIKIFCLSYPEFLQFHGLTEGKESFLKYVKYGGLPYLIHLQLDDEVVYDYLSNVYNTILLKDIVARHGVRNVVFLERLVEYVADHTGSMVSAKKISDFLKSQRTKISPNVVQNYLSFLTSAFFLFRVPRFDIVGKKRFVIGEKYYFEDLGLRHAIIGYTQKDIGRVLENLVYLHLRINGFRVAVGNMGTKEIDFVCEKGSEKLYVQVAYLIPEEKVHEREFGNLLKIPDNYRKIVVSMDEMISEKPYKGVEHQNVRDFLMQPLS